MPKIGFACKWIDNVSQIGGIKAGEAARDLGTFSTTIAWSSRQSVDVVEAKLWELMTKNINGIRLLVERVATLPSAQRMVRISSDILPFYTHPTWTYFWKRPDVQQYCETHFAIAGDLARMAGVRLSFHPGQFCVLASDRPDVVESSIDEFEYHADMARWMGFGKTFQDFKINVHIGGRLGPAGILAAYKRLSPEAQNCITIENDENAWGLESSLELASQIPLVLDVHHHFVREGEYISCTDDRVKRVIDSWRGRTPTMHLSQTRQAFLPDHATDVRPHWGQLREGGLNKQKFRAHSEFLWNSDVNDWALQFLPHFDIMVEAKAKNLASTQFANLAASRGW